MKTAREMQRAINIETDYGFTDDDKAEVSSMLIKWESEIRADQDKITRHACAESLSDCGRDVSGQCIWIDEAHAAIMNTVAL